jgi:GWxTD domain-containing protein
MKKIGIVLAFLVLGACSINFFPTRDAWFTQHYIIMQDFEKKIYKNLSQEGKQKFQNLFWEARESEARDVFAERLDYVSKIYQKENKIQPWNTDRARIYLLNGNPASIDYGDSTHWIEATPRTDTESEDIQARIDEVWTYPFQNFFIYYRFNFIPPSDWRLDPTLYWDPHVGELEQENKDITFAIVMDMEQYQMELANLEKKK